MNEDGEGPSIRRRHLLAGGAAAGAAVGGLFFLRPWEGAGDAAGFEEAIAFESAYALELTRQESDGSTVTLSGRFADDDHYLRYSSGDTGLETYRVDGDSYFVVDGDCHSYPGVGQRIPDSFDPTNGRGPGGQTGTASTNGSDDRPASELTATGTATVDGTEVTVYELRGATASAEDSTPTYYVASETRYLRRLETGNTVVDYDSWGTVEPVTPPAMDCTAVE